MPDTGKQERSADTDVQSMLRGLANRFWRNWFLLVGIASMSTVGLVISLWFANWPSSDAERVVLLMFAGAVLFAFVYMTKEQRYIMSMRRGMQQLNTSAIEHRYSRLYDLLDVSHFMDSNTAPSAMYDHITKVCVQLFGCQKASLMMLGSDGQSLEVLSAEGYGNREIIGKRQAVGEGIAGWVAKNRKPILMSGKTGQRKYPGLKYAARAVSAAIVVPVVLGKKLIGVLNISSQTQNVYYDDEDLRAAQAFAGNIAVCIQQAALTRGMRETILDLQRASKATDAKSPVIKL